jgi:hypothetical protein
MHQRRLCIRHTVDPLEALEFAWWVLLRILGLAMQQAAEWGQGKAWLFLISLPRGFQRGFQRIWRRAFYFMAIAGYTPMIDTAQCLPKIRGVWIGGDRGFKAIMLRSLHFVNSG